MNPPWAEPQFVLDFHREFLTLLVSILATSACVGIISSVMLLFLGPKGEADDHKGLI